MFSHPVEIPINTPVHVNTVLIHSNGVFLGIFANHLHHILLTTDNRLQSEWSGHWSAATYTALMYSSIGYPTALNPLTEVTL